MKIVSTWSFVPKAKAAREASAAQRAAEELQVGVILNEDGLSEFSMFF